MSSKKTTLFPAIQRLLEELGENIRLARLRRKLPAAMLAERAAIARNTLRAIERGDSSVTLGAYANVLFCLGLENDLKLVARDDELGRKLQDLGLPIRARAPKLTTHSRRLKTGYDNLMKRFKRIDAGKHFTRKDTNER